MKFFKPDGIISDEKVRTTNTHLAEHEITGLIELSDGDAFDEGYVTLIPTRHERMYLSRLSATKIREVLR